MEEETKKSQSMRSTFSVDSKLLLKIETLKGKLAGNYRFNYDLEKLQ